MELLLRETLILEAPAQGLSEFTDQIEQLVERSQCRLGLAHLFLRHTSASLVIQENADPAVQRDLEAFLARLVPEGDPLYTHTAEGPDDMPAHVKGALTTVNLSLPVADGALALGTWQGIFLWEHRRRPRPRSLIVTISGLGESR